ncbi:MAG: oligoendopeptidase F [Oscillospiraceae bacterium]|jgi:oligoendopeptidase F
MSVKERAEIEKAYKWDLGTLFSSDEEWEKVFQDAKKRVGEVSSFKGTLDNADSIKKFLDVRTSLSGLFSNLAEYAVLRYSEDTRDSTSQSMYSRVSMWLAGAEAEMSFAEPEILSLDSEKLDQIASDPLLADYEFLLRDLIRRKPHTLSAGEEMVIAKLSDALETPGNTADALRDADLTFEPALDSTGTEHEVTESGYIPLQMSSDRVLRRNSFKSFYKSYKEHINTFANTYAGAVKTAVAEADLRHYPSSREMSMSADNIPVSVYDNLIDSVHRNMDKMYRYLRLRKRILGVDELHYYDVYAPLSAGAAQKYSYEQAQELVAEAVSPLGQEYVERVRKAYKEHWIDVYPNKGKRSGAFSAGTYDSNPFILMNFTGNLDSVSTLAHEMGHSQHTWLATHTQPRQYSGYSLFVAEIASTVNENLLVEQLLSKEDDPARRLALLNQYLEGFKGTVYRQTMFAEFEKQAHAKAENGESLDPASFNGIYLELIKKYFGSDLVIDDEVQYEWARIPHFYSPFYVYVYATGYSSAAALSSKILSEGEPARRAYLEFLSMGGSRYPLDELRHAGVDLTTPKPIDEALEKFGKVLDDAEACADKLGF